jgi:nicotinamide-nucleotide amidase
VFPPHIEEMARAAVDAARAKGLKIVTAESCTGGLVAGALTAIVGSSDVFDRGFVTYANAAKTEVLGAPAEVIEAAGAVSEETARAMAHGALAISDADLAVAVTGIAGPGGGTAAKPVGLVWFAVAGQGRDTEVCEMRYGDLGRGPVRLAAVCTALEMLLAAAR